MEDDYGGDIQLGSLGQTKKEDESLVSSSVVPNDEEFKPIQKDTRLFKYILYTTKIEIKFNNFINLIYNSSMCEIGFWIVGFLLFIASPSNMYLIWVLIVHLAKGILGIILLNKIPKTYEILENVASNPNYQEDKLIELIQTQIKESFLTRWDAHKAKFLVYVILTIICIILDFIIFIVQAVKFGKDEWILMQTCILLIILIFFITDTVYFLWFFTLKFSMPEDLIKPLKNALFGSAKDLRILAFTKLKNIKNFRGRS